MVKRMRSTDLAPIHLHPKIGSKFALAMQAIASSFFDKWKLARKREDEDGESLNCLDLLDEASKVDASSLPEAAKQDFLEAFGVYKAVFSLDCSDVDVRLSQHDSSLESISFNTTFGKRVILPHQLLETSYTAAKEEKFVWQTVSTGKGGNARFLVPASVASFHS